MKKRYHTDSVFRAKARESQRKWVEKNRDWLRIYWNDYKRQIDNPKTSLLRNIKRANQRIIELDIEIVSRKEQIHIVDHTDRPRVKRALRNLQETLESVTAKRDNYEQLFKENFVD